MRIALLIRSLIIGGAERQCVLLAKHLSNAGHTVDVLVYYREGNVLEDELAAAGINLVCVYKRGRWDIFGFLGRLMATIRSNKYDVIYSFLPTSNVFASLIPKGGGWPARVWSVRCSAWDMWEVDWAEKAIGYLQNRMSVRADAIIVNSQAGIDACVGYGWPQDRVHLVKNIVDTSRFLFSLESRSQIRDSLGIESDEKVIGVVGRIHPVKGIELFIVAFAMVVEDNPSAVALMVGEGDERYVESLRELSEKYGISSNMRWVGGVQRVEGYYSAIDVLCSVSHSEGCSNAILEACASQCVCVSTNVGDAQSMVDPQFVIQHRDPEEVARTLIKALEKAESTKRESSTIDFAREYCSSNEISSTERVLRRAMRVKSSTV